MTADGRDAKASDEMWASLVRERPRVVAMLASRGENVTDAEDYVHEAFVRVAQLPYVDLARVRGLMSVVALRLACDSHRRRARGERVQQRLGYTSFPRSPEEIATLRSQILHVLAAASRLPAQERAVIELHLAGLSPTETSTHLQTSYKAVESALSRARAKLRMAWPND